MASFQRAIALAPELAEAHNDLGQALLEEGRVDEALAALREALRLRPEFVQAHNNLGIAPARRLTCQDQGAGPRRFRRAG